MAQKTYGIDFGTGTIKVYKKGQGIVMHERNVVSTVDKEKKTVAIGEEAYEMFEKVPPSINVSFPISHGIITDIDDMTSLCDYMMYEVSGKKRLKGFEFYIAVPTDINEVDRNAYARIVTKGECKPKKVFLIDKPVADAYGLGLDVEKANGILIVDMGADTTEVSILSRGGIVVTNLLPYGGNYFDEQIMNYIRKQYKFVIGMKTAEQVKKSIIAAYPTDDSITVTGRNIIKGLPDEIKIASEEVYPLVADVFHEIAATVQRMLEHTPPEISHEIVNNGIYLTGGSSGIRGLDQLIANETYLKVNTARSAQKTVINGLGYLTEHSKLAQQYAVLYK